MNICAQGSDRRANFYCCWFAPTTLWNYLQEIKGKPQYNEVYGKYIDCFSPAEKFERLLNDPKSKTGENLLNFSSAFSMVAESGDKNTLDNLIAKYKTMFKDDQIGMNVLTKVREQCEIVYPSELFFWKIPGDGKNQYKQITQDFHLYYTEEIVHRLKALNVPINPLHGDIETTCRVTLWNEQKEQRTRIGEFYPSEGETLFILAHKATGKVFALLRKQIKSSLAPYREVSYYWNLYYFNLRTLRAETCLPISFLGTYGKHDMLKEVRWTKNKVNLFFMDWHEDKKTNILRLERVEGKLM